MKGFVAMVTFQGKTVKTIRSIMLAFLRVRVTSLITERDKVRSLNSINVMQVRIY